MLIIEITSESLAGPGMNVATFGAAHWSRDMDSGHVMWADDHGTTSLAYHNKYWHADFHNIEINKK